MHDIEKLPAWARHRIRVAEEARDRALTALERIRTRKANGDDDRLWIYSPSENGITDTPAFPLDLSAGIVRPVDTRAMLRVHPALGKDVGLGRKTDGIRINGDANLIIVPMAGNDVFITTEAWNWNADRS